MLRENPRVSERRRIGIARNITWLASASLLVKPAWLLFIVVLCWRYLGTAGFGVFSTALWLAFIPASLTDLGLNRLTVREVARSRPSASRYFSNVLVLRLAAAPFAWAITIGVGIALGYEAPMLWAVGWASVYAVAMLAMTYARAFFQAFENLRLEGISIIVEKVLVIGCGVIGLITTRTAHGTLALMAIGLVVALALNLRWISRNLAKLDLRLVSLDFLKSAVVRALPLGLYAFFIVIYLRIGGVLLEYWHGEQAAGEFAPAFRILEALFLLPAVFSAAILPRLSTLYHEGRIQEFRLVFSKSLSVALGLSVIIAAGISSLAPEIMALANPDEPQTDPARILSMLVWVFPLMTTKDLLIISLIASDRQRFLAWGLGAAVSLAIALHFVFTLKEGAGGLVTVFFVVESLVVCLCFVQLFYVIAANRQNLSSAEIG